MKLIRVESTPPHYVLQCDISEAPIARQAGFRWNALLRQWWTSDIRIAAGMKKHAGRTLKKLLDLQPERPTLFDLREYDKRKPVGLPLSDYERMLEQKERLRTMPRSIHET